MTDIGNRPAVLRDKSISAAQLVLMPGILVVLNVVAMLASVTTSSHYDHSASSYGDRCGQTVSMSLDMTVVMWLAVAAAGVSVVLAVVFFRRLRSYDTGPGRAALVRVLCLFMCPVGIIVTILCIIAILQRQPSTVTCGGV